MPWRAGRAYSRVRTMAAVLSKPALFSDEDLMAVALSEAGKVHPRTVLPNPRVGAAILTTNEKLYFGHHSKAGSAHAEVEAMRSAAESGASLVGATVAVTLEPCAHTGRTPPCADALIKAGFARVIVGLRDPDTRVSGRGIQKLKDAGIEVVTGVLEDRCQVMNREWLHAKASGLPYVFLKMATSLDGLWTAESGDSKWITGTSARTHAQTLRQSAGAIVTSLKTVATDDPLFNAREKDESPSRFQPDLVVVSRQVEWGDAWATGIYRCQQVPGRKVREWKSSDLRGLLADLHAGGHTSCMIEAGPELSSVFLNSGLVQEIWHYQGARYLGGNGRHLSALARGQLPGLALRVQESHRFADGDLFVRSIF